MHFVRRAYRSAVEGDEFGAFARRLAEPRDELVISDGWSLRAGHLQKNGRRESPDVIPAGKYTVSDICAPIGRVSERYSCAPPRRACSSAFGSGLTFAGSASRSSGLTPAARSASLSGRTWRSTNAR